jgi:hypothetical protein
MDPSSRTPVIFDPPDNELAAGADKAEVLHKVLPGPVGPMLLSLQIVSAKAVWYTGWSAAQTL